MSFYASCNTLVTFPKIGFSWGYSQHLKPNYCTWRADIKDLCWKRWTHSCLIFRACWQELQLLTFWGQLLRSAALSCLALLLPHQHLHSLFVQMCCQNESICFKSVPFYFKSERRFLACILQSHRSLCLGGKAAEKWGYSVSQTWRSCLYNTYKSLGMNRESLVSKFMTT